MAAIQLKPTEQLTTEKLTQLYRHCVKNMPRYARPLFLRIEKDTRVTSTFKHHKVDLIKEGFDPNVISDKLYYISNEDNTYLPLNKNSYKFVLQSRL